MFPIKSFPFLVLLLLFGLSACSRPIQQVSSTGWNEAGTELSYQQLLVTVDDQPFSGTEVERGATIKVAFEDINGFTIIDGKNFPSLIISLNDSEGNSLMSPVDLLSYLVNGIPVDPTNMNGHASLDLRDLPVSDTQYLFKVEVNDRKGPGKIIYEMPFVIVDAQKGVANTGIK